MSNTVLDL